jgi:hypothetical protein
MKLWRDCGFSGVGDLATGLGEEGRVSSPGVWVVGRTLADILPYILAGTTWSSDIRKMIPK